MSKVRLSAVAGYFYPSNKEVLIKEIQNFLEKATQYSNQKPYALIVPHAGYIYSGSVASLGYKSLIPYKEEYKKILILGPSHFVSLHGLAYPAFEYFETPLGKLQLDQNLIESLREFDFILENSPSHSQEHSIEVQLPFIQFIFGNIPIVPLTFGKIRPEKINILLRKIWNPEILVIVSSDLSHYYSYEDAKKLDKKTSQAIENLDPDSIGYEQACGRVGIQGLLLFAKEKNWKAKLLDLRNSGDTAGSKDRVVGYGVWSFFGGTY